jgi:ferrous iron transport protein A
MTDSSEAENLEAVPQPPRGGSLCGQPATCSLAQATAGASLRVKELNAPAEVALRLRELGFCEQQRIRLLSKHTNVICQVCNVRLGISRDLAGMIMVEVTSPGISPGPNGKERAS